MATPKNTPALTTPTVPLKGDDPRLTFLGQFTPEGN